MRRTAAPPILLLIAGLLCACMSPQRQAEAPESRPPRLATEAAVAEDGYRLPLRHWGEAGGAKALLLALHGFNDYANAFADLGPFLAERGILTYAYDQRGFGATSQRGRWAGEERLIADLRTLAALLRQRHPDLPLYLLGESMGGAVVMAAGASNQVNGIVLIAPAMWSRATMNPLQRLALWAGAHTLPWLELTGRGLEIRPSDNRDRLRALGADPLVIKGTRIDTLWGVANLMDRAAASAADLPRPALILYGEHDEIIPKTAFCAMLGALPRDGTGQRLVLYANGWHMLTRDLQGNRVLADIAAWLADAAAALPSGEEIRPGSPRLDRFCPAPAIPGAQPASRSAPAAALGTGKPGPEKVTVRPSPRARRRPSFGSKIAHEPRRAGP